MSWLFSLALVEEYLAARCSGGEPSALLSANPMPQAFLPSGKMTDFSRPSRFGMTFAPSTDGLGEELLTWFQAGFRARTSAPPARAQESTANVPAYGGRWRELLVRYDRASCSWRTHRSLWDEDLSACSLTLPKWGSMRDGVLSELQTLERPTAANDAGLWPTPTVCGNYNRKGESANSGDGLATAVKAWPTPTASLGTKGGRVTPRKVREGGTLIEAVSQRIYATPMALDWRSGKVSQATMERNSRPLSEQVGGSLNPTWVEKLMGWPDDWTSLQPMSHVKMCFWLMGMNDGTKTGRSEVLRVLRIGDAAQEIQREIGRPVGISEAAFLLAELCEHANRPDEARVFLACAEALEEEVRGVRLCEGTTGAPHRPRQDQQRTGEHPDALQALSRLLAHHGKAYWQDGRWEDATPRVADGVAARVDRLKALGNGQVPQCAAQAWRILTNN